MIKLNIKKSCSIVKTCIFNKRYYICCKLNYQTLFYRSLTYINERYFFRFDINFYSSTNCSGCQITGVLWLFFFLVMFFCRPFILHTSLLPPSPLPCRSPSVFHRRFCYTTRVKPTTLPAQDRQTVAPSHRYRKDEEEGSYVVISVSKIN